MENKKTSKKVSSTKKKSSTKKTATITSTTTGLAPVNNTKIKAMFPGLYSASGEAPVRPSERSKNSIVKDSPKDEKQSHVVYEYFNEKMFECLSMLKVKLPHNKAIYDTIGKTMQFYIDKDVTTPMTIWNKTIQGHEHAFREYNAENVKYFLEHAPNMEILDALEIKQNWHYFKPSDIEKLWLVFGELLSTAEMTSLLPMELMTAVQQMTFEMDAKGQLKDFDSDKLDLEKTIELVMSVANQNKIVREGMEELTRKFNGESNSRAPPPSYANLLNKLAEMDG